MTPEKRDFILNFVAAETGASHSDRCMEGRHHTPDSIAGLIEDAELFYDMTVEQLKGEQDD